MVSAICAISDTNGTHLPMDINQPEMIIMLRKLEFRVIDRRRFQIWIKICVYTIY